MVLWLIGLGLYDERDITLRYVAWQSVAAAFLICARTRCTAHDADICDAGSTSTHAHTLQMNVGRGLEAVRKCSRVYLEAYTSILLCNKDRLVSET